MYNIRFLITYLCSPPSIFTYERVVRNELTYFCKNVIFLLIIFFFLLIFLFILIYVLKKPVWLHVSLYRYSYCLVLPTFNSMLLLGCDYIFSSVNFLCFFHIHIEFVVVNWFSVCCEIFVYEGKKNEWTWGISSNCYVMNIYWIYSHALLLRHWNVQIKMLAIIASRWEKSECHFLALRW